MTTQPDWGSHTQGSNQPSGETPPPEQPPEPPAIQINAPKGTQSPSGGAGPEASASGQTCVESMLRNIMARLDETDRKYGEALKDLYSRLNELSQRAEIARAQGPEDAAAALERVSGQASNLAERVREADTQYEAQRGDAAPDIEERLSQFAAQTGDDHTPTAGAAEQPQQSGQAHMDVSRQFADVTAELERSLASGAPAAGPAEDTDSLSARMDALARRFDEALATKSDLSALHTIENQLNTLAESFATAREHFTRLDTIEQELRALSERTREADQRTVKTLDAMNTSLELVARHVGLDAGAAQPSGAAYAGQDAGSAQPRGAAPDMEFQEEVWIETGESEDSAAAGREQAAAPNASNAAGGASPGRQPPPGQRHAWDAPPGGEAGREEASFQPEDDFIASARRAANAAQAQARKPKPARDGLFSALKRDRSAKQAAQVNGPEAKRPRSMLVAAAIFLLLVSASLLYSRLNDEPATMGTPPAQTAPPAPERQGTPDTGAETPRPDSGSAPKPDPAKATGNPGKSAARSGEQQQTFQTENQNGSDSPLEARLTPARLSEPATTANTSASATAAADAGKNTNPSQNAFQRETVESPFPGVTMTINQASGENTPAELARPAARNAVPLLVPAPEAEPETPRAPKRVPIPEQAPAKPEKAADAETGAAQSGMPPARVGPQSLRIAAAKGNPAAQFEVASRYAKGGNIARDPKKAAEWYRRAATEGFAPAQYRLATLYERGEGVKNNPDMARIWYRRAADLGNVKAMHNLAVMYTRPESGDPDYAGAKEWFVAAARHGLVDSQFNLGVLYEKGLGVSSNAGEAYKWYSLAAAGGDGEAQKRREQLRQRLPAQTLKQAQKAIRQWQPLERDEKANAERVSQADWQEAGSRSAGDAGKTDPSMIARAQYLLNKLGYDAGAPDGLLGPKTESAIRRFETRSGFNGSGKVTSKLLSRLEAISG